MKNWLVRISKPLLTTAMALGILQALFYLVNMNTQPKNSIYKAILLTLNGFIYFK